VQPKGRIDGRVPTLLPAANSINVAHAHCAAQTRIRPRGGCREVGARATKPSTKDQAKGKLENLKGKITEVAGIVTGQRKLRAEGKGQKLTGEARDKLGQVEKVLGK
jgi:uncharacterized protein YjbJ (UPF0337 family)